jgi:phage terminase large subunit GpA-like protein
MDACSDSTIPEVVVMKSAQVGWTEILNNSVGFHVHRVPAPIMLMQPTLEMAEAWSKDRFAPMVRDTPVLREKIADPKSRDSGNTLLHKNFTGGHLTVVGANSPSSLASRPIRILLCDEVDRFPVSAGTEGDPINLAKKRTATFGNRKILMGSTPTVKGASRIESAFQESDQRYYFVPCPDCGEFQRLLWEQVKWDEGKPETAHYVCKHCGTLISDESKPEMLRRGEWRASHPFNGVAGFHISELYSPWSSWPEMAIAHTRAKRLPETLQTWVNTALGETWEIDASTVEPGSLLERRESYDAQSLPDQVSLLTAGIDTQDDRVEVQVNAWGEGEENWIVEQRVFRGDPGKPQLWLEVDEYLLSSFATETGRTLFIEAACVDSGGHNTQAVYNYVVSRKRRRVWAIKGMAGAGKLAWPKKASRTAKSRAMVFIVGVDTIKSLLYGRLSKVPAAGPGYIHLPREADENFCKQLTSEKSFTKYVRGRPQVIWEPRDKGAAQEAQDCWVYAYAAFMGRGGHRALRRSRVPSVPPSNAPPSSVQPIAAPVVEKPKPISRPMRSGGWVKGWRF